MADASKKFERIKELLKEKGIKQFEVAAKVGMQAGILGYIFQGRMNASEDEKQRIAKVLGRKVKELI